MCAVYVHVTLFFTLTRHVKSNFVCALLDYTFIDGIGNTWFFTNVYPDIFKLCALLFIEVLYDYLIYSFIAFTVKFII